jgi:Skp family chaperone for outer membrane proteins
MYRMDKVLLAAIAFTFYACSASSQGALNRAVYPLGSVGSPPGFDAPLKIGYVDLQRAINESAAGRKAKADCKAYVDKAEAQLESLKNQIEKLKEEERPGLETEYRKKLLEFERTYDSPFGHF